MRLAFRLAGMGKLLEALTVWEASSSAAGGCSKESCKLPGEQHCSLVLTLVVTQQCHMPCVCLSWVSHGFLHYEFLRVTGS